MIDWASLSAGDPAIDLVIAWDMPPGARKTYRDAMQADDATWARARAWAVQQTVLYIPYYQHSLADGVQGATQRLRNAVDHP